MTKTKEKKGCGVSGHLSFTSSRYKTRSSSRDETANVNFFYDDIVPVLQNTKLIVQRSKIRLAVEFENN